MIGLLLEAKSWLLLTELIEDMLPISEAEDWSFLSELSSLLELLDDDDLSNDIDILNLFIL